MDARTIKRFRGLNTVRDPLELGLDWLTRADNVVVDRAGKLQRRDGYGAQLLPGAITGAYCTEDHQRFYLVRDGELQRVNEDHSVIMLRTGLTSAPMHWAEINGVVYYSNGPDKGLIYANDSVRNWGWPVPPAPDVIAVAGALPPGLYRVCFTFQLPDGRETGGGEATELQIAPGQALQVRNIPQEPGCTTRVYVAPANSEVFGLAIDNPFAAFVWNAGPDQLGRELAAPLCEPPPAGAVQPAFWKGSAWLMEWVPGVGTVVWQSKPLGFHLFDTEADFIVVMGRGLMLTTHPAGLIVGTSEAIHVWDGERITQVASYGVVAGWPAVVDVDAPGRPVYIWTQRGACRALPFENLTERRISVAPGVQVGAAVIHRGGNSAFIASLQAGGTAHNAHS